MQQAITLNDETASKSPVSSARCCYLLRFLFGFRFRRAHLHNPQSKETCGNREERWWIGELRCGEVMSGEVS